MFFTKIGHIQLFYCYKYIIKNNFYKYLIKTKPLIVQIVDALHNVSIQLRLTLIVCNQNFNRISCFILSLIVRVTIVEIKIVNYITFFICF